MRAELEWMWKEVVVAYSRYYPSVSLMGLREISPRIADVPIEIRTEQFPNTSAT
jgi:hypothetical protein